MERYFIAPDDIYAPEGGLAFHKGQRVQVDESSPMFTAEALEKQGLVSEQKMPAQEPGALDAVNTIVDTVADGKIGELFQDPTGEDSTPVHILKSAGKGLVSSVAHGVTGFEKGIVGGTLDVASAGARVLGGDKLADDLQRAKRFNDRMMDLKPLDDALLGEDPGRAAWDAMMGVSEGLGAIAGGVAGAKPLAAGLKAAKVAKTAEGAMKGAFTAQMAAGGEEAARTQVLSESGASAPRDLTWRERAEVGYHTLKEGITAQFFGKVVGAFGKKIGNAGAAALEFGGINAAGVLADAYIGDNIAGREWKDEKGNVLAGNEKDKAVLAKAGAAFAYGGMQSLLMSMGGGIAGRKAEPAASQGLQTSDARLPDGAAEKQKSGVGSQKSSLQTARQKAAAAMVQAAADPESAAVAARGANGETLMKNGALVRVAEDGATEIVTPDGVVLDADGKVKTVTAGNVGETGEGSYGTAIAVRTNPLTGRPTAARETVRNALVALQEGVTIDQLREIDGWTPENKAVFETVARLKQGLAEGMPAGELVDALAGLGIGERDARAFGFIPEGNRYVGDALAVANNGTRSLQNAVGNGGPGQVPLDIAAEVARSVNAGTTGLMPKELAKRQLETARQLVAERAKAKLEESAAEHGNTPEAERAVLDTPVEKEDGTLTTLGEMAETAKTTETGNLPEVSEVPEVSAVVPLPPGTSNTLRARHEREQSVKALGLKPLGDGSYGVGRFPQMRVEKADGVADETGRPVSAIRVTGLDPAEMLRPENILDAARVLGDMMEKCAARGVRVDFEPEAVDAVKEVMAKWETDVRTDPVLRARAEVVTSLLEKSGLASGIVTDQAGFEAALREKGGAQAEKLIVDGLTYGFVDPASGTVYLNPAFFGTKVGLNTPIHEFGHLGIIACRKINRPLYDRGIDLIKQTKYWQEVTEHPDYKNDNPVKNAEEALTRLIADRGEKLAAETPKGVLAEIKQWLVEFWKTFGDALGLRDITPEQVEKMTVEQIADAIRAEMLRGERFGTSRAQVEAQRQGGRRLKAGQRKRSPKSYIEAGGGKASNAFIFWAENGKRIMNVPKPGEFGWDIYNQLVLGQKDPAERARIKRILCGDQPKNTRKKGNDEILAEFNRRMGGNGDIYTDESGFQQMVEEFLASHADYERWRAEGAKSAEEMEEDRLSAASRPSAASQPSAPSGLSELSREATLGAEGALRPEGPLNHSFDPAELEEWGRMYDESRLAMAEAGLRDEPDARVSDDAMWARGPRFSIGGVKGASQMGIKGAAEAEAMEKAGASREDIWRKTGWWRAKDGKWRVELPQTKMKDERALYRALIGGSEGRNITTLDEIMDAPELFKAYPQLKATKIVFSPEEVNPGEPAGWYDRVKNEIVIFDAGLIALKDLPERERGLRDHYERIASSDEYLQNAFEEMDALGIDHGTVEQEREYARRWIEKQANGINRTNDTRIRELANDRGTWSVFGKIIHEVQHAVQRIEGFARGASGEEDGYSRFAGEVEARNSSRREAMTPEERAATPPWATEDVPEDRQIIRFSRATIGTDKGVFTTKIDTKNPKTKDGKNTVIFRRNPSETTAAVDQSSALKAVEGALPGGVKLGDKGTRYTPEQKSKVRAFVVKKAKEQKGKVENPEFGEIVIGRDFVREVQVHAISTAREIAAVSSAREIAAQMKHFAAAPNEEVKKGKNRYIEYGLAKFELDGETYLVMGEVGVRGDFKPYYDQRVVAKLKAEKAQSDLHAVNEPDSASAKTEPTPLILHDGMEADSAFDEIYDNRFRILLQAYNEWQQQSGGGGNSSLMLSRGGYKPGDWRKTFTFGKAARGGAEQTNGGLAAGEERRRWEENPVDERIPEWDAPQRNPNIAKPFALSSAEGVRLVKLLGGVMKKPKAYKDAIGVIDESDEQRIREELKSEGFFKGDDFLWAATATPAEVAADRADSQAALDARLEKLGEQRLKGEAGGGNRGLVRVSMSQVADLVLSLPAETGGNLGNVRTLAQGIVRGFEKDRTPGQQAYYFEEARNLLDWFYGRDAKSLELGAKSLEVVPPANANSSKLEVQSSKLKAQKLLARAFGAFLEAPDAVAERAPGLYREFVDAISRNDKLLHAFDAIRRTALGEGSAERVYAEIEAGRTARAEEAARRLEDEVEKPIGSRLERAKDSFVYNFDDMHGPIFMHITRAQKRQLAELKASLKAGRITQADYDAATAAFRQAVQGLKIAELKVDRGTQNEIRQYLWDYVYQIYDAAKREGVDPGDLHRYRDLRWIVASGGRAGSHGMSARDAQIVLDNMKRHMGDEAFARLDGAARRIHAVREKNILDDPRCLQMMGQARVNCYKNNAYYVRTERTRATPEELAQIERDRAAYRREHGDADDVIDAMLKFIDGTGNVGRSGYDTWSHELLGSEKGSKDRDYATCKNDVRIMIAMERNDFVIKMRDALLNAKAVGCYDLPAGSGRAKYPQNARYGHIRYFENGRQRVLVVPRVLADGYRQVSDAMTGWSAWGKIAHGVFIDWNLGYTLRNMTRNMASNEANIVGMRADNATILGNAIAPGVGRAASMVAYQIARHLPSAVFRNRFVRTVWGGRVNAAYAGQAQRILELYLDPRKAVERRAAAEEARLRGVTGPAMELDADLELMRFMTKSGALIARWDKVQGAGRDADLFLMSHGLGPIYGDADASAPKSLARKIGGVLSYPFRRNAQFNRDLELHAKITAMLAIHEMQPGLTAEQVGIEVARRASIPWGERQGRMSRFINYAWNMFYNTALKGGQRFVGNIVRNPRLAGKMVAQSLGPQLFWATMIAGGGLAAVIRNMFGGGDDAEEKARQAGLGWLLDYTQFMHDGSFAVSPYLQRFYHWCPLGQVGERYIGIALPRTDEEKMLLPFIDWAAAKFAPQPTDPTATLGDAVKRGVVGTFVPDLTARTPLVAAAQDLVFAWWQNPMDTYRGTHVYDNSLWQARGESVADAAAFAWATVKQGFNDLGGRTIVRPRRNEIEVAEGSGAQPPSFAEKAWDTILNDIPVLSGVLGGSLRMTLTKEQRLDQVERELLAPIRAVKNRRSEEIMKMMLESPVANNGSETPEIKEKLDAWAKKYEWDEAERDNVFARAFNGYQAAKAAAKEAAAQKKEKNRRVRYNKMPNSEKKAVEAAGLREILAE